jgi:hypothetical protein
MGASPCPPARGRTRGRAFRSKSSESAHALSCGLSAAIPGAVATAKEILTAKSKTGKGEEAKEGRREKKHCCLPYLTSSTLW